MAISVRNEESWGRVVRGNIQDMLPEGWTVEYETSYNMLSASYTVYLKLVDHRGNAIRENFTDDMGADIKDLEDFVARVKLRVTDMIHWLWGLET